MYSLLPLASVLPSLDPSSLLSLGFQRPFSDREALEVVGLLSLFQDEHVILGSRDVRIWSLDPSKGFTYHSFFSNCLPHLPLDALVCFLLSLSERLIFQGRLRCLCGRFYMGELIPWIACKDSVLIVG